MQTKTIILLLLILSSSNILISQDIKRNNNWILGFNAGLKMDFNTSNIVLDSFELVALSTGHSCISKTNGELEIFSSGFVFFDKNGYPIKNGLYNNCPYGDTLFEKYCQGYSHFDQTSIILPKKGNQYYVFSTGMSDSVYTNISSVTRIEFDVLNYSVVDMDSNSGKGEVIDKNLILLDKQRYAQTALTAVRHGNNNDWWLVKADLWKHQYQTFLVKEDTILGPYYYTITDTTNPSFIPYRYSQIYFSDDGTKMVSSIQQEFYPNSTFLQYNRADVFDFDRNVGQFTFKNYYKIPVDTTSYPWEDGITGVQFSPNGSLLYMSTGYNIFQIDINDNNPNNGINIHGPDTTLNVFPNYHILANAPNGKMYIGNFDGTRNSMSYIDKPNIKGLGCDFKPQSFSQPYNANLLSPPNMPNYGLGQWPLSNYEAVLENKQLMIYPIPTSDQLTIEHQLETNEVGEINIYDLLGNKVIKQALNTLVSKTTINVKGLAQGVYTYKCVGSKQQIFTGKIIIE